MKVSLIVLFASMALVSTACRTLETESQPVEAFGHSELGEVAPLTCSTGAPADSFILTAAGDLPDASTLPIPRAGAFEPIVTAPTQDENIRMDICFEDEAPVIKRVLFVQAMGVDEILPVASGVVVGLEAALEGEVTGFSLNIPFETYKYYYEETPSASEESLFMRGLPDGRVVATYAKKVADGLELSDRLINPVLVGKLEFGDFAARICPMGVRPTEGVFRLGNVTFEWWGCQPQGTSGGASSNLYRFRITDPHPSLPEAVRGQPITVDLTEEVWKARYTHHSVCESFALKVPHATYAATSDAHGFGGGACPDPVEGAPMRPNPDSGGTIFKFTYGTQVVNGSQPNCRHFTRECEQNLPTF